MTHYKKIEKKLKILIENGQLPQNFMNKFQKFSEDDLKTLDECLTDMLKEQKRSHSL